MKEYIKKEIISEGWSGDKKYKIMDKSGNVYFLRISHRDQFDKRKIEFDTMNRVMSLGVEICRPIEFGICEEGVYVIQQWINGKVLREIANTLSDVTAYSYGCKSGEALLKIHSIEAPANIAPWKERYGEKIEKKIKLYLNSSRKYKDGHVFLQYCEKNKELIENRPQCFQHGDFHTGNMMIDEHHQLIIIDFDRSDYGDPWEEFNRIVWCVQDNKEFARGLIDGYFKKEVPILFWKLLKLYISSNTLSSLPWALPYGEEQIKIIEKQADAILGWYDHDFRIDVPNWYNRREDNE